MSIINKAAVLNPFNELTSNILNYIPRATPTEFGIVAIGSGINVDILGRIYLDTQEYSDRLTAIEAQAASTLATQKSEVAAAITQANLTQSQAITALTLEVSNLKTNLTNSITATQTELITRADQLTQNVADITVQLTQDKATFTQDIQDALDFLKDDASIASALRTPRKIQGVDFDGTQDINLPTFTTQTDGLVPKRVGATTTKYLREDGTWIAPPDTTYPLLTQAVAEGGTATATNTISAKVLKEAIQYHAPTVTNIAGNAGTATKLQTPRTINGISFDGTQDILLPKPVDYSLPTASASELGGIKVGSGLTISNSVLSVGTLNQSTTGNAATASKLQTARTISLTGKITGSVSFDGSANASISTTITGLGAANGIATLDSNGQVPSTQLPSYVDDVLEYVNVAAFPSTGVAGKIYVETTGNTTYRWGGTAYVKITSGEVSSVVGKTGVVTLTKADVGLDQVDNTPDTQKPISTATQLALNDKVNKADVIDITKGGTGATTAASARINLGMGNIDNTSDANKPVSTNQSAAIVASASNLTILIKDSLRQSVELASGGLQTVLYTAKGQPTYMNIIQKYNMSTIDASMSGTHPAFIVDGVEKPEIFIGTYQGKIVSGELLSLPNVDPTHSTNYDNFLIAARANGNGHHLITNAEWSAVALQCYKNGTQPLGNSYYGRSSEDPLLTGRRVDGLNAGNTDGEARTLTGSGPVQWRHNGKNNGIADLSGNIWECNSGMRLLNGEIQIIENNNAAKLAINLGAASTEWKAIDGATGVLVTPNGLGTTAGTVKFAASGTTADYTIDGENFGAVKNLSTAKPVGVAALNKLKALCLFPHIDAVATFNGDGIYLNLTIEVQLIRGGYWGDGATAGVFGFNLYNARSLAGQYLGSRPAFVSL